MRARVIRWWSFHHIKFFPTRRIQWQCEVYHASSVDTGIMQLYFMSEWCTFRVWEACVHVERREVTSNISWWAMKSKYFLCCSGFRWSGTRSCSNMFAGLTRSTGGRLKMIYSAGSNPQWPFWNAGIPSTQKRRPIRFMPGPIPTGPIFFCHAGESYTSDISESFFILVRSCSMSLMNDGSFKSACSLSRIGK